jgi:hypothetical protein
MARGKASALGDRFTNQNGYTYEKTEEGWRPVHQLIAEKFLGRSLKADERAVFVDGDRHNLDPSNIRVVQKYSKQSLQAKLTRIEEQVRELEEQARELRHQIANS